MRFVDRVVGVAVVASALSILVSIYAKIWDFGFINPAKLAVTAFVTLGFALLYAILTNG